MIDFFARLVQLFDDVLAGEPLAPTSIRNLPEKFAKLKQVDIDLSGGGIETWLRVFRELVEEQKVRETLLIRVVQLHLPRLAEALTLAGVIKGDYTAGSGDHTPIAFTIDWDQLEQVAHAPGQAALNVLLGRVNGISDVKALQVLFLLWVASPKVLVVKEYEHKGFLALPEGTGVSLEELIKLVNSPVCIRLESPPPAAFNEVPTRLVESLSPNQLPDRYLRIDGPDNKFDDLEGLALTVGVASSAALRGELVQLDDDWSLAVEPLTPGPQTVKVSWAAGGIDKVTGGGLVLRLARNTTPSKPALAIGQSAGIHVSIGEISVELTLNPAAGEHWAASTKASPGTFSLNLKLDPIEFGVDPGFLHYLDIGIGIPRTLNVKSKVVVGFLQGHGLTTGSGNLGVEFPYHLGLVLGGSGAQLRIDDVLTRIETRVVKQTGGKLDVRALFRLTARADLGPLTLTATGGGSWLGRWNNENAGMLLPTGIGVQISAGPVTGGGMIAAMPSGEYGGALDLKVLGIGAFAYGLYRQLAGGGVSFVALIGIRLPYPGVQLGFGFAVSGFGGLIGINREANTDLLRERLSSGTSGDVLFNDNPTKNAPKLLGDLARFFPTSNGTFVVGPTLQLNWLRFITLDAGVFIELPGPRKVFIAGSGRVTLGTESTPVVKLRLDFIGGVDLTRSLVSFDGHLIDSTVLGFIKITGGMALRLGYGGNPYFLFSIGGFHPGFHPPGLELPALGRAGAGFDLGVVWFKQETYLAVTSNTLQFGSNTEAGIEIGPFSAHGWIRFDALIQFRPFHFIAAIDAGFDIAYDGMSFAGVRVRGELSGPGPLTIRAQASIRFIVKISKSATLTLDSSPGDKMPDIDNLGKHLEREISRSGNVRTAKRDDRVILRPDAPAGLLSPVGDLIWEQRRVPLNIEIERAEGVDLKSKRRLTLATSWTDTQPEYDRFGLGTFMKLGEADSLNTATFSEEQSGVRLRGAELDDNSLEGVAPKMAPDVIRIPELVKLSFNDMAAVQFELSPGLQDQLITVASTPVLAKPAEIKVNMQTYAAAKGLDGPARGLTTGQMVAARRNGAAAQPEGIPTVNLEGVKLP